MNESLQSDIASADPLTHDQDLKTRELVRSMAAAAQSAARKTLAVRAPWWKRRRAVIPLGLLAAIAMTGAAAMIPLTLGVDGTPADLDVEIPIIYTTRNGIDVSCRYGIYFGAAGGRTEADEQLADFAKSHDWTGIGQRIYDQAVADPFVPGPDDYLEVDNQETRDGFSFDRALDLIWAEIPEGLRQEGHGENGTSDCTGRLR